MNGSFTILEHPADIGIEARGVTLANAFEQAATGLMSIIVELSSVGSGSVQTIELQAGDREQLLVKWLTEILYLYDGQQFVSKKFKIEVLTDTLLKATIQGEPLNAERHQMLLDVKAITYHQLSIEENDNNITLRVYLDI